MSRGVDRKDITYEVSFSDTDADQLRKLVTILRETLNSITNDLYIELHDQKGYYTVEITLNANEGLKGYDI